VTPSPPTSGRRPGAASSASSAFPPHVLREYALLADGERGAVVGPRGDIVWMCVPRWDSDAIFSALVGGQAGYTITPEETYVWGGYYEDDSMIWRNRWTTRSGIIECRDALVYPAEPHRAILLRQVRAVDGPATVTATLQPRGGYDQHPLRELHRHAGTWTARVGDLHLRWSGAQAARTRLHGEQLVLRLTVPAGGQHDLVLETSDQPLPDEPVNASECWRATEAAWTNDVPSLDAGLAPRDTRRSYAVLRGLTSTGGGMVAAATTSLPERAEAGRNYDYRYVWIRDQCYAGIAVAAAGAYPLLDDAVAFVAARLLEHGDRMAPAYTTTGAPVPDQRHLGLPGYPGGYDLIGNWVNKQFQLDAYGEALQLFAAATRHDRLDTDHWTAAEAAATAIQRRWTEPDAGIWEIEPRAWTHSRLTAAGGLRAIAAARPAPGQAADWIGLADTIIADTSAHALHPDGHWQRSPKDPALDASLLLPGLRGAVPPADPRNAATLNAYLRELTVDGYAYRFRHDQRPLADAEGSFLLCGFLTALALHQHGEEVHARGWYERTRAASGPAELFSEEYDARQHQMRGNLPQAFVHALMIETSTRLAT
jgi:GH15 family glucan-1,4-alpha-glucosidase